MSALMLLNESMKMTTLFFSALKTPSQFNQLHSYVSLKTKSHWDSESV